MLFGPDLIVIGGGVCRRFDEFSEWLSPGTEVVAAGLRNEAGIVGAALAAAGGSLRSADLVPIELGNDACGGTEPDLGAFALVLLDQDLADAVDGGQHVAARRGSAAPPRRSGRRAAW